MNPLSRSHREDVLVSPGRRRPREAEHNDVRLLSAAREAFAELGWDAPVSEIAKRAGVGVGSVYRRYSSKEELAQHLCVTGMSRLTEAARWAAAEVPGGWQALVRFMSRALMTQPGTLLPAGGRPPATREVEEATTDLHAAVQVIVDRAQAEKGLRADVVPADVVLLLVHLKTLLPATAERSSHLRLRYLDVVLDGLRCRPSRSTRPLQTPRSPQPPRELTGPAPDLEELRSLWHAGAVGTTDGGTK